MTDILSRAEAKRIGSTTYFTGRACVRGHIGPRKTANGDCYICINKLRRHRRSQRPGYRTRAEMDAERSATTRECSACGQTFPLTTKHFSPIQRRMPNGDLWTGFARECRPCRNKRYAPYYRANKKKLIARAIKRTKEIRATPEGRERERTWGNARHHRKKIIPGYLSKKNALARRWRANNPDKVAAFKHMQPHFRRLRAMQRYAAKLNATPRWLTDEHREQIEKIYLRAVTLTLKTSIPHDVDHYYPLKGETSCGLHVPWNLRVIPAKENQRKSNKAPRGPSYQR
jgi:hypothetical protein